MQASDDSFSKALRAECSAIWDGLHAHPFLREMAAGTLPLEKFRFFLEQDNLYLEEYARCLAMGAAKAGSEARLRSFTTDLTEVLEAELPSNRKLLEHVIRMGAADRGGSSGMAPANVAYTSYMQATSMRGGPLEITAVLLPCAWSYAEIAERLATETTEHPVYTEWIAFFSDPENVAVVTKMRDDFDALVAEEAPSPSRREQLAGIFATSSRLEREFWDMAYRMQRWPDLE